MQVTYIGNFRADQSTETHVARALEANGHTVERVQENDRAWARVPLLAHDMVLWTTTYDFAGPETFDAQRRMLEQLDVPSVGFHLDRWWGLHREGRIVKSPFFQCDLVITADGGHDDLFEAVGVNHAWLPPAVSEGECVPGHYDAELASPIAFVGSWQGGYHHEWKHRQHLVDHLTRRGAAFWPKPGEHAVRGERLRDLYASVDVLVGDSCLSGGATFYASDRIPETIGRGGFLIHPRVEGITDGTCYTEGEHLACWELGNWSELDDKIDYYLAHPEERRAIADAGRAHVLAGHTYEVRVRQMAAIFIHQGLLDLGMLEPGQVEGMVPSALPALVQDR